MQAAFADIAEGLVRWRLWLALANEDMRNAFRRTHLGALWFALSFALLLGVKLLIFGAMTTRDFEYFAIYLTLGFLAWELLSAIAIEGCTIFSGAANWISGVKLPLSVFAFRSLTRLFMQTGYKLIPALLLLAYFGHAPSWTWFAVGPALVLIAINGFAVQMLLGAICVRYRDLQHLVANGVRILFFLSPIVWTMDQLGSVSKYLYWNPFYHFIEILRTPLLEGRIPVDSWIYAGVMTLVLVPLAVAVFAAMRRNIPFWV